MDFSQTNYKVENIKSIEVLPDFDDEYVYDIEVGGTHMFFANEVLVHNSIYVEFGRILKWCNVPKEEQTKFVVDLWNYSLGPYMNNKYEEYAKEYNCDKNIQNLELEKIADTTLLFAKKRYAMSECWLEPNIYLPKGSHILYKGLEIVKSSTSEYARECMEDFVKFVLDWYRDNDEKLSLDRLVGKIEKYKADFDYKDPDMISFGSSVGNYDNYILKDKGELVIADKCPAHIKAAGVYNYFLNKPENKKYKVKYNPIKNADKIKWFYSNAANNPYEVFAYVPGSFPGEFRVSIDMEIQFEKTILSFCNKVLDILGYQQIPNNLVHSQPLF